MTVIRCLCTDGAGGSIEMIKWITLDEMDYKYIVEIEFVRKLIRLSL